MHAVRRGSGKPLLLVHGLGGNWRSWEPIPPQLAAQREVVAVDLPGFGETPPTPGEISIARFADELTTFLHEQDLSEVDMVGSSMGARLVLEMARRGVGGATVALSPGGFWSGWQLDFFSMSLGASIKLVRLLQPVMPALIGNPIGCTVLLSQFSARPWALPDDVLLREMRSYANSPSFDAAPHALVHGPAQEGMSAGTAKNPIVIGWGRQDRVCLPNQSRTARHLFPDAELHWFAQCGHFPRWDKPHETIELILSSTAEPSQDLLGEVSAEQRAAPTTARRRAASP